MTVCISVLADNGTSGVVISDKMLTFTMGGIQYQSDRDHYSKIYDITEASKFLIAGGANFADEICKAVINQIKLDREAGVNEFFIEDIVNKTALIYQQKRLARLESIVLLPRGLNLATYRANMNAFQPLIQEVETTLMNSQYGVEMIAMGKNREGGYSIYTIMNPGVHVCHDVVGYAAIGSGGPHATYSLLGSAYTKSLTNEQVETIIKEAKKAAEFAPGVGQGECIQYLGRLTPATDEHNNTEPHQP